MDIVLKLVISAIFGLIIGIEREVKRKPLGFRTCLVISVIACMLTITSLEASNMYAQAYSQPMDAARIPSYILSGIGFLGAGVIMQRRNDAISGLTTAALVWSSAGVGITIGFGFILEASISIGLILFGIRCLPYLLQWLRFRPLLEQEVRISIRLDDEERMTSIITSLHDERFSIVRVKVDDFKTKDNLMEVHLRVPKSMYLTDIYYLVKGLDGVSHVKCENL
ncbi:MgtC/SapB family protein [Pontibacillus salicampi]|uniref:MgtC/SapB family protein n=1 Tax=Pontibacillus salicampi TaxID=1449801 RepID=A0ABV6LLM6_9BACI